ncbi:MAG: hypothetical protein ACD_15C00204G0018 [uncultured bacterium]|nr:MAG: hypothetical protein ACD_15C00204G0018 [uncultured bacterium]
MANINLSTRQAGSGMQKRHLSSSGNLIGGVLLIIAIISVVVLSFWEKKLKSNVAIAESSYEQKYANLTQGRNRDVIDFQSRIFALNNLARQRNSVTDNLQNIEKYLVPGVYVSSYKYDKNNKIIQLRCVGENHDIIAKQIASFKNVEYFSNVNLISTKVNVGGGFEFLIEIVNK